MARIEVFPFKVWDPLAGAIIVVTRLSTRDFIRSAGGEIIEGRMRTVDESLVDHNGRIVLDSGIEGVKFLKELDAVGHAEAPRHVNLKHTTLLANAGLVTRATGSSPGMVAYDITKLGRQFVHDLLS